MKFCPKCNDRMIGVYCTTCDKDKLPERVKFSDYSNQKLKVMNNKVVSLDEYKQAMALE